MKVKLTSFAQAALNNALATKSPKSLTELRIHSRLQKAGREFEKLIRMPNGQEGVQLTEGSIEIQDSDLEYLVKECLTKQVESGGVPGHLAQGFMELLDAIEAKSRLEKPAKVK